MLTALLVIGLTHTRNAWELYLLGNDEGGIESIIGQPDYFSP
jgi:hypothetical protein